MQLLDVSEGGPVSLVNGQGKSDILLICEHASRRLPVALGALGLEPAALEAHIAWDPGALAVAELLSVALDAALIHQNYSRLAYDCNRPPEASDAMPAQSEIFTIPGNVDIDPVVRQARIDEIYTPFTDAIAETITERNTAERRTVLVTIHSFTPVYKGVARDVEVGILHDADARLADQMLEHAKRRGQFVTRRNEPYGPADGVTHTLKLHGLANGLLNVMIEVRNDLIKDEAGQRVVADFLAGVIRESLSIPA
ncbi:N-formylglutamate amidohydrolase [Rhizobium sp. KVB221]|uniref:N-formylglutamate amidohydrolase n=1 Tax=Rhizobium setariae TaxID=2801340 RepID=A0A936YR64_9HYPH|nr:N-formylglutamate amidohydrolase [Rhizobium setariae]MBL0375314.1 N-formylglutamate amidohydrolase [Rhizobium setariae]